MSHKLYCETNLILARASILIVDYSSIWVDYLILDRPIIFFSQDLEHYVENERGLNYKPEFFPGERTENMSALITAISQNIDSDPYQAKRLRVKQHFHDYPCDTSCSEALVKAIPELSELF